MLFGALMFADLENIISGHLCSSNVYSIFEHLTIEKAELNVQNVITQNKELFDLAST